MASHIPGVTADELAAVAEALRVWRAAGVETPRIPVYRDIDGDGVPDAFALDEAGEVILVPGVDPRETVAISSGLGFEQEGEH
jgi:hypothetical protein